MGEQLKDAMCAHGIRMDVYCSDCQKLNQMHPGRVTFLTPGTKLSDVVPGVGANGRQVGGAHYRKPIQHWDYVVAQGLDYFQGQVTKYVSRWRDKAGMEDLKKARHFLDKYIEEVEAGRIS